MTDGLVWGGVPIAQLARDYDTPLYVYDVSAIGSQLAALRDALCDHVEIYYSVKANPNPSVVRVCVDNGVGCEIASAAEYERARAAGCAPHRIVFAGPGKGENELTHVIERGIGQIHVESDDEIATVGAIARRSGRDVDVAIRVNPRSAAAGGAMQMGGRPAAFGIDEERLGEAVSLVGAQAGLVLRGLHQFAGTQILDARVLAAQWRHAVRLGEQLAALTGTAPHSINLGGGLGIPYFADERPLDLAILRTELRGLVASMPAALAGSRLLVEPGRFLVGPCGVYVTRVRAVKISRGTKFVIVDGGMHHHLAASGNLGQVLRRDYPLVNASRMGDDRREHVTIVGCLCTPLDTLARNAELAPLRPGDLVAILQSGAYGLTASPTGFLSHPMPAEVLVDQGKARPIRARGTFETPLVALPVS
jgi:diaminopimelate decarboxylase